MLLFSIDKREKVVLLVVLTVETSGGTFFRPETRPETRFSLLIHPVPDPDPDNFSPGAPTLTPNNPDNLRIFSIIRKESNHYVFNDILIGNKENQLAIFSNESVTCEKLNRLQPRTNNLFS